MINKILFVMRGINSIMKNEIFRIYVEKKKELDVEGDEILKDIKLTLGINSIENIRIINRYDIEGITKEELDKSKNIIFSEPVVDYIYEKELPVGIGEKVFGVEYLPGQYDQRADSAIQCVQILTESSGVNIKTAKVYILKGNINKEEFSKIKSYCINAVDSKEASLEKPMSLDLNLETPKDIKVIDNFINFSEEELKAFIDSEGLALSLNDLKFCKEYFIKENRNPSITEIKVIDTYWSDHCRHTTFNTVIEEVNIEDKEENAPLKETYENYLNIRKDLYKGRDKKVSLMDIATIAMKKLSKEGKLEDLDKSEEINACSITVNIEVHGKLEEWLVMFKNETHNHPTEIEPFGGAATCLGGAIRDPLSGRSYVYQAMRVTGSGDPRKSIEETLEGKLPQKKITLSAAKGYSSYGNQIGLATGHASEVYHEGFVAKRMEVGAVIGAVKKENVIRETPMPKDCIILLGGRTGRDGCGGATGSSKEHDEKSIVECSSEVQKGNAPTERKIQRFFRNEEVIRMIKRCNDFGAGGVSVAVGEIADGLNINLDLVPKKYEGLDGTELAISESQERMAIAISPDNVDRFIKLAHEENLEATKIGEVTEEKRLRMYWRENLIVDIHREFLNSSGATSYTNIMVKAPEESENFFNKYDKNYETFESAFINTLKKLNVCSQKGLVERFDSSIGAGTVVMPFGGKYSLTPSQSMAAKIPMLEGETNAGTIMSYGYNPYIGEWSPFHGGLYAVIEAVAKIVASGGDYRKIRLSCQEYFEKLGENPEKWGKPFSALLGALKVQTALDIPAIGGKDSMSGSFKGLHVPPTLIAFGVNVVNVENVISPEFKGEGHKVVLISLPRDKYYVPNFEALKKNYERINSLVNTEKIISAYAVTGGGIVEAVSKMAFGNKVGVQFEKDSWINIENLLSPEYGSIVVEFNDEVKVEEELKDISYKLLGETTAESYFSIGDEKIDLDKLIQGWEAPLESVFKTKTEAIHMNIENIEYDSEVKRVSVLKNIKPEVFIPVFPGTNCEYDTSRAFQRVGAKSNIVVFKNNSIVDIEDSIEAMVKAINSCNILMIPGGFSAGDEPDGSGKFIATVFRNERIKEAAMNLLNKRDGLALGICNGFQALIKLGLVPYGEIREITEDSPTLTYNKIGRHVSRMVRTKIASNKSPWFSNVNVGDTFTVPVSHGEGRFVACEEEIKRLIANGQIATQYVDFNGNATYDIEFNPNGSYYAVEGITSPDGRVLGKMAHSERIGENVSINVYGEMDMKIFKSGVEYFK